MNGQFRSARRTLGWGLLPAICLAGIVLARGVHPDVLLTFRDVSSDELMAQDNAPGEQASATAASFPTPPEVLAAVPRDTRFDGQSSDDIHGPSTGLLSQAQSNPANHGSSRRVHAQPNPPELAAPAPFVAPTLDESPEFAHSEFAPSEFPPSDVPGSGSLFELPPAPESVETPAPNSLTAATTSRTSRSRSNGAGPSRSRMANSTETVRASQSAVEPTRVEIDPKFVDQLNSVQEQLQKLAALQEQQRLTQQSWLDAHYHQNQQLLTQKLDGIESGLRSLQERTALLQAASVPEVGPTATPTDPATSPRGNSLHGTSPRGTTPRGTVTRNGRTVSTEEGTTSRRSGVVREVLDSLADRNNVNLTLSINVEGDVEMSLQDEAARGAVEALRGSQGYFVEKGGRRTYVPPQAPQKHQREAFLPPIIKDPAASSPR